ncbi:uncharacterized protein LOC116162315 [Photinus pyralis]|uniref:uncharacterized protein LOC116162315 n=1 Tax=Photinus pyralis TaxID=7054 RepID=UPI001266F77C|nr:uncharacterized protein LOC116162315 [Photinus pyralis]
MRYLYVLLIVIASPASSGDFIADLDYVQKCNETSPIASDALRELVLHEARQKDVGCFLHCLLVKYGWMDEEGGILPHNIEEAIADKGVQFLNYILSKCTAGNEMDKCERSLFFVRCFWQQQEETGDDRLLSRIVEE